MSQEPIQIILVEPVAESVAALTQVLGKSNQMEILAVPTPDEAWQVAQQFTPCLLFVSIRGSLDGEPQLEMLKKLEKQIRTKQVKPLVVSTVKNHPLARNIAALGVTDYAEEPIPTKSLLFKVNILVKAVLNARKKNEAKDDSTIIFKTESEKEKKSTVVADEKIEEMNYKPALQLAEDVFVFKGAKPKKAGRNFIIEGEGPAIETGEWKLDAVDGEENKQWRWEEKNTDSDPADNGWIFEGEKPVAKNGKWQFTSKKPELFYKKNGKKVATKMEVDENGRIVLAEDSVTARDNLMLNKTLAAQAREELINAVLSAQEKEAKSVEAKEEKVEKEQKENKFLNREKENADKNVENKPFNIKFGLKERESLEKTKKQQQSAATENAGKKDTTENQKKTENIWNKNEHEKKDNLLGDRQSKKNEENRKKNAANMQYHGQEEKLKGLDNEDLVSEKNLRDRMSSDLVKKLKKEEEAKGLKKDQLEGKDNLFAKKSSEVVDRRTKEDLRKNPFQKNNELKDKELKSKGPGFSRSSTNKKDTKANKRAEEKAKARILELKKILEEEEQRPIREELTENEERALRHELGVTDKPEIGKRELNKLAKHERVKALRKQIAAVEDSLSGSGVPLLAMFPSEEGEDWQEDEPTTKKSARKLRAIDSGEEIEEENLWGANSKKSNKQGAKNDNSPDEKNEEENSEIFFLARSEVEPEDGSWEREKKYWIYLPNKSFADGIDKISSVLPCWIFEGEIEPQLLEEKAQWKFIGMRPEKINSLDALPKPIRTFLKNLQEQGAIAAGLDPEALEDDDVHTEEMDVENLNGVKLKAEKKGNEASLRNEALIDDSLGGKVLQEDDDLNSTGVAEENDKAGASANLHKEQQNAIDLNKVKAGDHSEDVDNGAVEAINEEEKIGKVSEEDDALSKNGSVKEKKEKLSGETEVLVDHENNENPIDKKEDAPSFFSKIRQSAKKRIQASLGKGKDENISDENESTLNLEGDNSQEEKEDSKNGKGFFSKVRQSVKKRLGSNKNKDKDKDRDKDKNSVDENIAADDEAENSSEEEKSIKEAELTKEEEEAASKIEIAGLTEDIQFSIRELLMLAEIASTIDIPKCLSILERDFPGFRFGLPQAERIIHSPSGVFRKEEQSTLVLIENGALLVGLPENIKDLTDREKIIFSYISKVFTNRTLEEVQKLAA